MVIRKLANFSLPWPLIALGFLTLSMAPAVLFGYSAHIALLQGGRILIGTALALGTIGVGLGARYEWWELRRVIAAGSGEFTDGPPAILSIILGMLLTYAGTAELGLTPIVSAGLVGMAASILVPAVSIPAYCGAFVGMTSPLLFETYWEGLIAAAIASFFFVVVHPIFHGVGGKLGTTAFVGVVFTVLLTGSGFHSGSIPPQRVLFLILLFSGVAAVVTFLIHSRMGFDSVFASGIIGAVGGFLLPTYFGPSGTLVAASVYSASFVGMTAPRRIYNGWWIGVSGVGVGLVFVYTTPILGGSGGKLGTLAFGTCLGVHGLLRRVNSFRIKRRDYQVPEADTT